MEPSNNNQVTRFGQWLNESLTVKLVVIFFVTIALLIPGSLVSDLVRERQYRQVEVVNEVSQSWSGAQTLSGPILMLPYNKQVRVLRNGVEQSEEQLHYIYLLPEEADIKVDTDTKLLSRGIFDVAVYEAGATWKGHFSGLDLSREEVLPEQVLWSKVRLLIGVGDLRGVKQVSPVMVNGQEFALDEYAREHVFTQNLVVTPQLSGEPWERLPFEFTIDFRGTSSLQFLQTAKHTTVQVAGNWASPKFIGQSLPDHREVKEESFSVAWDLSNFARTLPTQWSDQQILIQGRDPYYVGEPIQPKTMAAPSEQSLTHHIDGFGVEFLQPVNHYHKNERATKYAILIIVLSFLSLFFTEIIAKRRIHIVQYVLIGAAMMVFYALLLALSEHIGFNMAYGVASLATIAVIGVFISNILRGGRLTWIFTGLLSFFYLFVFIIIQLHDMALLMGSIGLFLSVAALMYFSSRINWQGK